VDPSAQDLRAQFFAALDRPGDQPGRWLEIWRLFLDHPWYQAELKKATARVLRNMHPRGQWNEDIQHDAMLLLARHLRRAADLHVDRARARTQFSGWMATIIKRDCQQAARSLRTRLRKTRPLPRDQPAPDRTAIIESAIDIALAIDKLPEPSRTVTALYAQSWTLQQIASKLKMKYAHAARLCVRFKS
jgi:DNA-directed RNA polymerase specialized sigma24 family protein